MTEHVDNRALPFEKKTETMEFLGSSDAKTAR